MRLRLAAVSAVAAVLLAAPAAGAAASSVNPQIAGLQVALRAQGLYRGAVDAIAGPLTAGAVRAFQRSHGLPVTGLADARTRAQLGPLGRHLFGSRTLARGSFGWDVAVLQFLLASHGISVPVNAYFDGPTRHAVRVYQHEVRLPADGVAGPRTFAALGLQRRIPVPVTRVSARFDTSAVRASIDHWAGVFGVDAHLVRALAWMESGDNNRLVSSVGARGVMQLLPSTWSYVETVLLRRKVAHTADGNVHVGVAYLDHLLHAFGGDERLALAAWYQGERAVREQGVFAESKPFVADVLALSRRM
ncbi:MAG TPA: peptidoglycan-binding protein [Gaiellaceae bacterium]|nr:peptidoglycan-binding protein [Gaiellaceae bacterium]